MSEYEYIEFSNGDITIRKEYTNCCGSYKTTIATITTYQSGKIAFSPMKSGNKYTLKDILKIAEYLKNLESKKGRSE